MPVSYNCFREEPPVFLSQRIHFRREGGLVIGIVGAGARWDRSKSVGFVSTMTYGVGSEGARSLGKSSLWDVAVGYRL